MSQIQFEVFMTIVHQLPDLVKQLEIANKLKAWELKHNHHELGPTQSNAIEIDNIMKGD